MLFLEEKNMTNVYKWGGKPIDHLTRDELLEALRFACDAFTGNLQLEVRENVMTKTIEERVKIICVEHLGVDAGKVKPDSVIDKDLGADSLDHVELVMAFEEEFDIEIPDADAEEIKKVSDAIAYIEKHCAAA